MKIPFWLTSTTRTAHRDNWGSVVLGGAEISAKNLGDELRKNGRDVTYFLEFCDPFDAGNLHVRGRRSLGSLHFDVFICVRPSPVLTLDRGQLCADKVILWSGDAYDQPSNKIFDNKSMAETLDAFVFKTKWQRDEILKTYRHIDVGKSKVICNAVKEEHYADLTAAPEKNRFIYASTWYRGLHNFVEIWPKIKEAIRDAELHAFAMTSLYFAGNAQDQKYFEIADTLSSYPDIILRYPVPQGILIREMRKSWLMLYPNSGFVESSCGVALQSIAAGTPVVTTARAGLPETVGRFGMLVKETGNWKDLFAKCAIRCQDKLRTRLSDSGRETVLKKSTWRIRVKEWEAFLLSLNDGSLN